MLVYFGFEPRHAAPKLDEFLNEALDGKVRLLMSRINWGEFYYIIRRERGQAEAEDALRRIDNLPIEVVDVDREVTKRAAIFKATLAMPYADSFAAALAERTDATVVTADRDFDKVGGLVRLVQLL